MFVSSSPGDLLKGVWLLAPRRSGVLFLLGCSNSLQPLTVPSQVFSESKDEIALVLYGTDSTDNALAVEDQYQNITVHRHLMLPDFDLLEDIGSKIQPSSQQADCILSVPQRQEISLYLVNHNSVW